MCGLQSGRIRRLTGMARTSRDVLGRYCLSSGGTNSRNYEEYLSLSLSLYISLHFYACILSSLHTTIKHPPSRGTEGEGSINVHTTSTWRLPTNLGIRGMSRSDFGWFARTHV